MGGNRAHQHERQDKSFAQPTGQSGHRERRKLFCGREATALYGPSSFTSQQGTILLINSKKMRLLQTNDVK